MWRGALKRLEHGRAYTHRRPHHLLMKQAVPWPVVCEATWLPVDKTKQAPLAGAGTAEWRDPKFPEH